jgi:putative oxidoreductase
VQQDCLKESDMNASLFLLAALSRLLLAAIFLLSGLVKLAAPAETIGTIAAAGLPLPELGYAAALVAEIGGGLLMLAGFQTRVAAWVLAAFTLAAAAIFHHDFADQNQMIHFLKNLAIAGGFLQVAAFGAGRFSVDAPRSK